MKILAILLAAAIEAGAMPFADIRSPLFTPSTASQFSMTAEALSAVNLSASAVQFNAGSSEALHFIRRSYRDELKDRLGATRMKVAKTWWLPTDYLEQIVWIAEALSDAPGIRPMRISMITLWIYVPLRARFMAKFVQRIGDQVLEQNPDLLSVLADHSWSTRSDASKTQINLFTSLALTVSWHASTLSFAIVQSLLKVKRPILLLPWWLSVLGFGIYRSAQAGGLAHTLFARFVHKDGSDYYFDAGKPWSLTRADSPRGLKAEWRHLWIDLILFPSVMHDKMERTPKLAAKIRPISGAFLGDPELTRTWPWEKPPVAEQTSWPGSLALVLISYSLLWFTAISTHQDLWMAALVLVGLGALGVTLWTQAATRRTWTLRWSMPEWMNGRGERVRTFVRFGSALLLSIATEMRMFIIVAALISAQMGVTHSPGQKPLFRIAPPPIVDMLSDGARLVRDAWKEGRDAFTPSKLWYGNPLATLKAAPGQWVQTIRDERESLESLTKEEKIPAPKQVGVITLSSPRTLFDPGPIKPLKEPMPPRQLNARDYSFNGAVKTTDGYIENQFGTPIYEEGKRLQRDSYMDDQVSKGGWINWIAASFEIPDDIDLKEIAAIDLQFDQGRIIRSQGPAGFWERLFGSSPPSKQRVTINYGKDGLNNLILEAPTRVEIQPPRPLTSRRINIDFNSQPDSWGTHWLLQVHPNAMHLLIYLHEKPPSAVTPLHKPGSARLRSGA